jgi:2-oxo-3-hexenedioate decarboxylase
MSAATDKLDMNAIAAQVVSSLATHRQIVPFSRSLGERGIADAYRLPALLRAAFEARGERITGRKIGFTNRQMWAAHGVQAPIWGYCTNRTTFELDTTPVQRVSAFAEPRIEPEIVFGLGKAPSPEMDESDLLGSIDWIALGMVQSIFPGGNSRRSTRLRQMLSTARSWSENATRSRRARRRG